MLLTLDLSRALRGATRAIGSPRQRSVSLVATLTIGVAVATAVLVISFADAILFRPLPFPNSDRVVQIGLTPRDRYGTSVFGSNASRQLLVAWRRNTKTLSALAGYALDYPLLRSTGAPQQVIAIHVTERMFEMLGVRPALGTYLSGDVSRAGQECLLSDRVWNAHFGRDAGVVGRSIELGEQPCRVVGVMPAGFRIPFSIPEEEKNNGEIWVRLSDDSDQSVTVLGRLSPHVTPEAAERELDRIMEIAGPQASETAVANAMQVVQAVPMKRMIAAQVRRLVVILTMAAGCLVLIACTNVSVALAAGVVARRTEFAVRRALGERAYQMAGQVMLEAMIVALAGGALGGFAASRAIPLIIANVGQRLPDVGPIGIDVRVGIASVVLVGVCGVLSALAPVVRATHIAPQFGLAVGRGVGGTRSSRLHGGWLVAAQIALSLTLLSSMGALSASFHNLADPRAAYEVHNLVVASVTVSGAWYSTDISRVAVASDLQRAVAGMPGVEGVAVASGAPLWGGFRAGIRPAAEPEVRPVVSHVWYVSPNYFDVMRMHILRGRVPSTSEAPSHVSIDESAAEALFGTADPLGKRVRVGKQEEAIVTAVVNDVDEVVGGEDMTSRRRLARPHVYLPLTNTGFRSLRLLVRVSAATPHTADEIQATISRVAPQIPAATIQPMQDRINGTFGRERFLTIVSTWMAIVGFIIAMAGVYAVMMYSAGERRREFGLRMALGSRTVALLTEAARPAVKSAASGVLAGLVISAAFLRVVRSVVFEISPSDPRLFGGAAVIMVIGAALACLVPAARALRTDPAIVLRGD